MHKSISRRINNKLPLIPAKIYYFSLIHSQILYGLVVWGGALMVNNALNDLQDKQDKIVRALFSKNFPRKSLREVYIALNISNIKVSYKIRVSLYLFDILYTDKFPQLKSSTEALIFNHGYNTRKNNLLIPQNNFSKSKYHFLYNSIKIWNEIPAEVKKMPRAKFKDGIKKHFMSQN